jgi:hypothetical protein
MYIVVSGNGTRRVTRTFYAANDGVALAESGNHIPAGYSLRYLARVIAN